MSNKENLIYNYWLKSPDVPECMKEWMREMTRDEIEMSFQDTQIKFGTAGYRAIFGPGPLFLNKFTFQQLAVGYAKFILSNDDISQKKNKRYKIFIGHDNRKFAREMSILVAEVLSSFNIEVYLNEYNDVITTPMVSYVVRHFKFDGAINITASHNPKEYLGFKAYNSLGAQVSDKEANLISSYLPEWSVNLTRSYIPRADLINYLSSKWLSKYYETIKKSIFVTQYKKTNDPIVITTHHGAASLYIESFLNSLGHNAVLVEEQCYEDENFENSKNMNPEDPESFELAIELANKIHSDIAIGFDPDGDRMAVAIKHKGKWRYLSGNEAGILATYYFLTNKDFENKVPVIISTYVSTSLINEIAATHNALILRTGTGFKNIAQAMEHIDSEKAEYVLSFEEAIGMNISLATREKDSFAAAALFIEMYKYYKERKLDLIDILENRIYQKYSKWYGKTVSLKIPGNNWKAKAKQLEKKVLTIKEGTKISGLTIKHVFWNEAGGCIEWDLGNGSWIKFRISGTEPKFKIYINLVIETKKVYYNFDQVEEFTNNLVKSIKGKLSK